MRYNVGKMFWDIATPITITNFFRCAWWQEFPTIAQFDSVWNPGAYPATHPSYPWAWFCNIQMMYKQYTNIIQTWVRGDGYTNLQSCCTSTMAVNQHLLYRSGKYCWPGMANDRGAPPPMVCYKITSYSIEHYIFLQSLYSFSIDYIAKMCFLMKPPILYNPRSSCKRRDPAHQAFIEPPPHHHHSRPRVCST